MRNLVSQNDMHCFIVWCKAYSDGTVVNHLGMTQEHDRQTDILVVNDALNDTVLSKLNQRQ